MWVVGNKRLPVRFGCLYPSKRYSSRLRHVNRHSPNHLSDTRRDEKHTGNATQPELNFDR